MTSIELRANDVAFDKVNRHTVRPCARTSSTAPQRIILVPPRGDLAGAFETAHAELNKGSAVRVIGVGVTLARYWPSWATNVPGLWLTDLHAYASKTLWEAAQPLCASLRSFTDELFAGMFSDLRGSEVFYPQIGTRAFATLASVLPIALGLAEHLAAQTVTCVQPDWPGFVLYKALVDAQTPARSRTAWTARVLGYSALGWAASLVRVLELYVQSREGLKELRARRQVGPAALWVQLVPDWIRINLHLIEATRGRDLGVLLHGHIGPGRRKEASPAERQGRELWPGLQGLDASRVSAWDTTSIPSGVIPLLRCCAQFTQGCLVAAVRLGKHGPTLRVGSHHLDIAAQAKDLCKLITIDAARACLADAATANAIRKHDLKGCTVLSAGALASDVAITMRRLRRAGAITIDFAHGWAGEPEPFVGEPPCDCRCVWAHTDTHRGGARFIVGGMPVPRRLPRPKGTGKPRILLMSNYMHRESAMSQTGFDAYLDELLDVIRLRADRYAFRWRPHPADVPDSVSLAARSLPAEVSRERRLVEDLAWADVVISTRSSVAAEALLFDLPVLLHITPNIEDGPLARPFARERRFFLSSEGAEKLDLIIRSLSDPNLLAPENRTRAMLFGPTRTPRTLAEAIESLVDGVSSPIAGLEG